MILKQILFVLFFVIAVSSWGYIEPESVIVTHKCPSCATPGYVLKRWLMQDTDDKQSMGWVDWRGTNCDEGIVYVMECQYSCLTVTLEKSNGEDYVYQGQMQECSDNLIHSSPDLPDGGEEFKEFFEDAVYKSKRSGYRLTYNFTRKSFIDILDEDPKLLKNMDKVYVTADKIVKVGDFTFKDGITIVAIVLSLIIMVISCWLMCCKYNCVFKNTHAYPYTLRSDVVKLEECSGNPEVLFPELPKAIIVDIEEEEEETEEITENKVQDTHKNDEGKKTEEITENKIQDARETDEEKESEEDI